MPWYMIKDGDQKNAKAIWSDVSLIVVKPSNYAIIPVDPAGGHCFWGSTKPCESRGVKPSANCSVTRG